LYRAYSLPCFNRQRWYTDGRRNFFGIHLNTEALDSLLAGGIALANPNNKEMDRHQLTKETEAMNQIHNDSAELKILQQEVDEL
jgi:hypothetical protein